MTAGISNGAATMMDDDAPPIDVSALEGLEAVLDAGRMAGFIDEYIAQADKLHGELRQAWASRDWDAVYQPAHNLVSNAGNFGAHRVAMLADTIQRAARHQDPEALEGALAPLDRAIAQAAEALRIRYPRS